MTCERPNRLARLQLHALAYNLADFLRTLTLPDEVKHWSLTTLRDRLVKIGAKIVRHGRSITFQMPRSRCRARCSRPCWPLSRHSVHPRRRPDIVCRAPGTAVIVPRRRPDGL